MESRGIECPTWGSGNSARRDIHVQYNSDPRDNPCRLLPAYRLYEHGTRRPSAAACTARRYETRTKTNWHYECAEAVIRGA